MYFELRIRCECGIHMLPQTCVKATMLAFIFRTALRWHMRVNKLEHILNKASAVLERLLE